jgi:hypothetical protein
MGPPNRSPTRLGEGWHATYSWDLGIGHAPTDPARRGRRDAPLLGSIIDKTLNQPILLMEGCSTVISKVERRTITGLVHGFATSQPRGVEINRSVNPTKLGSRSNRSGHHRLAQPPHPLRKSQPRTNANVRCVNLNCRSRRTLASVPYNLWTQTPRECKPRHPARPAVGECYALRSH